MKKCLLLLLMLLPLVVVAQTCYKETRKEAINTFGQKNFKRAKQVFNAAKSCPDKPQNNDLNYWIGRCDKAMSPKTQATELSFAQKMALYEPDADWSEGLMAVTRKSDWDKYYKLPSEQAEDSYKNSPKVGFINTNGDMVIACQYLDEGLIPMLTWGSNRFSEGLAAVAKYIEEEGCYGIGYIDKHGKTIIPFDFALGTIFSEGLAAVVYDGEAYYDDIPSWHFINKTGELAFPGAFLWVDVFSEGLCAVKKDSLSGYGYIDRLGNVVIPFSYSFASPFKDGVAAVQNEGHGYDIALINKKGEIISDYKFRPQYMEPYQITKAIEKEHNAKNYLKCFEMCKECENFFTDADKHNAVNYVLFTLGQYYYYGYAVAKDYSTAKKYYLKIVENDTRNNQKKTAYNSLGVIADEEGDYASALNYYQSALKIEKKYYPALYNIGLLYYHGKGVSQDCEKALYYFEECAKYGVKGNAKKMVELCKRKMNNK